MVPLPPGWPCSGDELEHAAIDAGLPRPPAAMAVNKGGALIYGPPVAAAEHSNSLNRQVERVSYFPLFEKRNGSMQKIGGIISRKKHRTTAESEGSSPFSWTTSFPLF